MPPGSFPTRKGVNHWIAFSTISARPEMEPSPRPVRPPSVSTSRKRVVAILDRVLSCGEFPDCRSAGSREQGDADQQVASAEEWTMHMRIVSDVSQFNKRAGPYCQGAF